MNKRTKLSFGSLVKVGSLYTSFTYIKSCFTFQMSHLYSGASFVSHTMIKSGEEAKKASKISKSKQDVSSKTKSQAQQNKNYATSKTKPTSVFGPKRSKLGKYKKS